MLSRRVLLLVVAITCLVALPLVVNPRVHLRADAMSNTALAHAVRRHGLPPHDPYIAGQPLHYHWAYNAVAAGLSALTGLEPLTVMVVLGPIGLAIGLVWVARLVRLLGGGERGAMLAVVVAVVGLNGWGWLILAMRWVAGEVGVAESLERGVSPFLHLVVRGYDMRMGFLATKAMLSTSYIWTLALLPVAVDGLLRLVQGRGWRHGLVFALAGAGAAYANLLVGVAVVALSAAGLVLWACLVGAPARPQITRRAAAGLGFAAACVGLILPYALVTVGASAGREQLVTLAWPDAWHLRGAVVGLLPVWLCVGLCGWPRRWCQADLWLAFLSVGVGVTFLVVRAVDDVQVKFLFVLAMVLAVYVGGRAAELTRWRVCALWLVAASAVPTTALGMMAHARAPDAIHLSDAESATYNWIARHTPPDTVVVARERSTLVPILARRDLYIPDRVGFHRAGRYDAAVWRRRTEQMRRLFGRGEVALVLGEIAAELGRPVVLVTWEEFTQVTDPRVRLLHAAGNLRTWQLAAPPGVGVHQAVGHRARPLPPPSRRDAECCPIRRALPPAAARSRGEAEAGPGGRAACAARPPGVREERRRVATVTPTCG